MCGVTPTITNAAPPPIQIAPVALHAISVQVPLLQANCVFWPWISAAVPAPIKPAPMKVIIFPPLLRCRWGVATVLGGSFCVSSARCRFATTTLNSDAGGNNLGETKS